MTQQVLHARTIFRDARTFQDNSSITFTFEATGADSALTISDVDTLIQQFFNTALGGMSSALSSHMSAALDRTANATVTTYTDVTANLDGSNAGPPIHSTPWTLGAAPLNQDLPEQLAVACGYHAPYGSALEHGPLTTLPTDDDAIDVGAPSTHPGHERPRARLRARFYLGPLMSQTLDGTAGILTSGFLTDVSVALNGLCQTQKPGLHDQFNLVVWSRRDASVHSVHPGGAYFVNEGFATQRRRADVTENRRHNWVNV